ncbi:flagellin hook IN motif-containing protein [Methylobacterium sp. AMS5]|uniref:flagellin hook IN motif-containing protein n=1 Tax=Methylobacterium sp. AMS5 TaxID=925818 RepID=UPI00074F88A5|nr:flagellin hook IN motif-containing protein [Methylobacterium sp. AMS5]AMB46732.1 flagellin hook protein [Methylobacterium sp. AMS5]
MSSSITLSAATRQNLLSLQDTASLLATTQSRLSTGKKVNSALDNPINFFTATNLSGRSTELSSLLDGISNGVQTIQAANTGLSKLQSLTSQLKSTAQQALAATNAFTSKAASVSTALSGASAANLLSTGPTAALSDKAVGTLVDGKPAAAVAAKVTGSVDYKPTAAPSTMRGTSFTATTPTAAKATAASAFSAPGNAVAGTVTGGSAFASAGFGSDTKLAIKAGTGSTERTITVDLNQNMTADQAVEEIKTQIDTFNADPANQNNRSTVAVSLDRDGKLAFTGDTNGDQIRVSASGTGAAGTGFGATAAVSTDNVAAQTQKLTIGTREITISGGRAGADAADVRKAVLKAINDANAGPTPTGVFASFESDGGTGQRLVLSGKADGTNFTVTGSPGNTLGFGSTALTTANGAPAATQTLTINGTLITIPGGGDIDAAVTAINNQKGTTGVSAAKDPADATRLLLTGKVDGSAFTVASSNPVSSGFSATPTTTSLAATVSGVFTPDGTPATTTAGGAFQAPAGAVAGTLTAAYSPPTAGGTRLTVTSGAGGNGNTFTVDLAAGDSKETAARKFNDAFGTSGMKAAVSGSNLVFTGKSNGDALSITSGVALAGFTNSVSAGNAQQAQSGTVTGGTYAAPGAGGAKLTIKSGTDSPITVELAQGDAIGTALTKIRDELDQNSGISVALNAGGTALVFTGKTDGSALTVSSTGPDAGFTGGTGTTSTDQTASSKGTVGVTYTAPGTGGTRIVISEASGANSTTPISFDIPAGMTAGDLETALTTRLGGTGITVANNNGTLTFTGSTNNVALTVKATAEAGGFVNAGQASTGERTAVAGTLSATAPYAAPAVGSGGAKLTITSGSGATATTYSVDLTSTETSATLAAGKIQAELDKNGTSGITVSGASGTLVFTGKADGSALNVASTSPGGGFTATPLLSTGQKAADSQTITIKGATGGDQQITIRGGAAGDSDAKILAGALAAINDKSGTTGVTASASADGRIVLKGAATGAGFTVTGGPNSTAGFGTSTVTADNGKASAAQTLTVNGTPIDIAAGDDQAAAITAINAKSSTTGVSAAVDPDNAGKIKLTGKADGSAFTVQSSNAASSGFSGITERVNNNQGAAQSVTVNGTEIAIAASATLDEAMAAINAKSSITGVTAGKDGNRLTFTGGADGHSFTIKGSEFNTLGLASTEASVAGISDPGQTSLISTLGFQGGDSFSVNGQTVNLTATDTIGSLVQKVGAATNGAVTASYDAATNKFSFTAADSRTAVQLGDGSTATSKVSNLGFTATDFAAGAGAPSSQSALAGKSITVQVGSGTSINTATITFGTAPGQISTLAQLNEALAPANAQATIDSLTGKISITTSNDVGAQNLSILASGTGNPFTTGTATANLGGDGLNARNNLVQTYNDLLKQMDQLASDAGFNGVNLLSGDNLTINFNEKGSSSLKVQGSATNAASLGLSAVGQTNFQESSAIKKIVDQINSASSQLQSRAAALGSNLAVVQNRQDFTKQIITVLDTGAANLTSADLNEEAANSQALSTRNSLAISALSLANQSQQGILQLLR